jgi:hypothetical protein
MTHHQMLQGFSDMNQVSFPKNEVKLPVLQQFLLGASK